MSEMGRLMHSAAETEDIDVASLDVKTAFLYGDAPGDHFFNMRRPSGLTDANMPAVIRLRKCLYGLPDAPATLRTYNDTTLRSYGSVPTMSDLRRPMSSCMSAT